MHRRAAVLVLAGAALAALAALAGCGAGRRAPTPTTSASQPVAQAYLAIAEVANAGVATAQARLIRDAADLVAVQQDLGAIASSKRAFDTALRSLTMPTSAVADVHRLLEADARLEALLDQGVHATTLASLATVQQSILTAGDVAARAAVKVRADLGLPAPPPPGPA